MHSSTHIHPLIFIHSYSSTHIHPLIFIHSSHTNAFVTCRGHHRRLCDPPTAGQVPGRFCGPHPQGHHGQLPQDSGLPGAGARPARRGCLVRQGKPGSPP
ncbi:hypothetical protein B484DRAFT_207076 [Ochromonadaceae sp. CCMP2298]|nr:hypothetical protein B484DRAFT_207076 [Ochromonadaceae sp. CCMP2298]